MESLETQLFLAVEITVVNLEKNKMRMRTTQTRDIPTSDINTRKHDIAVDWKKKWKVFFQKCKVGIQYGISTKVSVHIFLHRIACS